MTSMKKKILREKNAEVGGAIWVKTHTMITAEIKVTFYYIIIYEIDALDEKWRLRSRMKVIKVNY